MYSLKNADSKISINQTSPKIPNIIVLVDLTCRTNKWGIENDPHNVFTIVHNFPTSCNSPLWLIWGPTSSPLVVGDWRRWLKRPQKDVLGIEDEGLRPVCPSVRVICGCAHGTPHIRREGCIMFHRAPRVCFLLFP